MFAATGIPYVQPDGKNIPTRGSIFRGGRSIVAYGAGIDDIAPGTTEEIVVPVREEGVLGKLVLDGTAAGLAGLVVTSITVNNDELISGEVPAAMFSNDSTLSPGFGHRVQVSDQVSVRLRNAGAAATGPITTGWSVG